MIRWLRRSPGSSQLKRVSALCIEGQRAKTASARRVNGLESMKRLRPYLSWIERLPSKWTQIQSKSLLRLRLRVSSPPCAAPKVLLTFTDKILRLSSSQSQAEEATGRALLRG